MYKIHCNITGEDYYGSTEQTMKDRMDRHESDAHNPNLQYYCASKQIIERGDYEVFELEYYSCDTVQQSRKREGWYILNNPNINKIVPGRTPQETSKLYRDSHKEQAHEYSIVYRATHKEQISIQKKQHREANKEELKIKSKLYRDSHKEEKRIKDKLYRDSHKEQIQAKDKLYRDSHKEEARLNGIKWREANKEKLKESKALVYKNTLAFIKQCGGNSCTRGLNQIAVDLFD